MRSVSGMDACSVSSHDGTRPAPSVILTVLYYMSISVHYNSLANSVEAFLKVLHYSEIVTVNFHNTNLASLQLHNEKLTWSLKTSIHFKACLQCAVHHAVFIFIQKLSAYYMMKAN
jgi:hypothetical protein